ncbi:MAG: histidine phosphatase family protein [Tissierellia bacterium]|nr:histidine phosphatase family protein [Tissierellia bacterium]
MKLIMLRHGQTEDNVRRVFPRKDCKLTELGKKQMRDACKKIREFEITKILSGPYVRTRECLAEILKELDLPYEIYHNIHEIETDFIEGMSAKEAMEKHPEIMKAWYSDYQNYRLPNSESFMDVYIRAGKVIEDLSKREGNLLLITHQMFIEMMLANVLENPNIAYKFTINNGSLSIIEIIDDIITIERVNY